MRIRGILLANFAEWCLKEVPQRDSLANMKIAQLADPRPTSSDENETGLPKMHFGALFDNPALLHPVTGQLIGCCLIDD